MEGVEQQKQVKITEDYFERIGGVWTRHQKKARKCLFTPVGVKDGPDPRMLLSTRGAVWKKVQIQRGDRQDGDGQQHQIEDDWRDVHAAHRNLEYLWTG